MYMYQAIMTLATLFPASFALMFGSIKSATVCKTMLPWSRLPGYVLGASLFFCLPMFMAMLAVIYQLVGDYFCMAAFLSLLLSLLVWSPRGKLSHASSKREEKGVLAPQSHTMAANEFVWRGRLSKALKVLTLVFIVLFVYSTLSGLERKEQLEVRSTLMSTREDLILLALGAVLDLFGKSYLTLVFCADITTEILGYIGCGDDNDGPENTDGGHDPSVLRRVELADIGVLCGFHEKHGAADGRLGFGGVSADTHSVSLGSGDEL
jgi:uncharacterized membrane protein YtjA (UPF0391 family)